MNSRSVPRFATAAALLLGLCVAPSGARADDAVAAEGLVQADPAQVRALLADYSQIAAMSPELLEYRVEPAPPCSLVHITTKGLSAPMHYTVRRCPTETGFRETLVESDGGVEQMVTEWTVAPAEEGSRVRLTVLARVAHVPQILVNQGTRRSIGNLVRKIGEKLNPKMR